MVEAGAGEIVLSIKYDEPLETIRAATERLGGIAHLADERPWIFDFLRATPAKGYQR
jgi:hypothetical protein